MRKVKVKKRCNFEHCFALPKPQVWSDKEKQLTWRTEGGAGGGGIQKAGAEKSVAKLRRIN